jgi:hypothetical protein
MSFLTLSTHLSPSHPPPPVHSQSRPDASYVLAVCEAPYPSSSSSAELLPEVVVGVCAVDVASGHVLFGQFPDDEVREREGLVGEREGEGREDERGGERGGEVGKNESDELDSALTRLRLPEP